MDFRVPSSYGGDTIPPMSGIPGDMMDPNMMSGEFHGNQMFHPPANPVDAEFHEMTSVWMDGVGRYAVTSLCFDTQELLWAGNQGGYVASYGGMNLQKYSAFRSHMTNDIRQILTTEQGVISLNRNSLRCSIRRGLSVFTYTDPQMLDMQCMIRTSPTSLLVGGHQKKAFELDLNKVQLINEFEMNDPGCAILRQNGKFLFAGDTSGKVTLYDAKTMKAEHVLDAHTGTLSDFDVQGNLIITCGFGNRMGSMTADRILMVYDMRVMRAVAPIQIAIDPMFLRFVSAYSNRLAVVSQNGSFQVIETTAMKPPNMMLYQVNNHGAPIVSFDISSSCQTIAFGDSSSYIHLFSSGEHPCFNFNPESTEFADHVEHRDPIHFMDERTPYSIIPMMYPSNGHLLSDWPHHLTQQVYRKPKPIDPELIRTMKIYHNAGYAPNPGKERRNQVPYILNKDKKSTNSNVPESPLGRGEDAFVLVPRTYKKLEMKYSKLGLADFDFRHYNKTKFAGLETHIPNAYCNAMLQVLYFIEPLRCSLLSHLCQKEFCLACELGFLFHMLDSQDGQTCQASNFLRAFRTKPELALLGLVLSEADETAGRANLTRLIQSWQRFVHQQIHSETCVKVEITPNPPPPPVEPEHTDKKTEEKEKTSKSKKKKKKGKKKDELKEKEKEESDAAESNGDENKPSEEPASSQSAEEQSSKKVEETSIITELFGTKTTTTLTCRCGVETTRDVDTTLTNLSYPDCSNPAGPNLPPVSYTLADVLKYSWMSETMIQAWCNDCNRYQPHVQKKTLKNIPDVIALNCQMENKRDFHFWRTQIKLLTPEPDPDKEIPETIKATTHKTRCRYGKSCFRKDCKFRHPSEDDLMEEWLDLLEQEENQVSWIPLGLKIKLDDKSNLEITQITDEEPLPKKHAEFTKYYELLAIVSHIKDDQTGGNLVSHIKVAEPFHLRKERVPCTQWYHINDFCIEPVERPEVTSMNLDWKVPCILYFIRRNITDYHPCKVVNPISSDILFNDPGLANAERRKITFTPLQKDQLPKKGDLVGLDAEFISLKEEEAELRSDGTKSTIKPSHMSVARITCIHGQGDLQSEPFIDDYIQNSEQVVDYLTQYSGIKQGDLDPAVSTKHLTTLKATYQKLRYLIDAGVVFIGHGLKKDFRVINLHVPKKQVIDTVQLFHLPRQRMISLKFLASYFLKLNIQSFTHDSVEDARTALRLYLKYQELAEEGKEKVQATIKEMYEIGRKTQWKIPDIEEDVVGGSLPFL